MGNVVNKGNTQTIPLGYSNILGNCTPQKRIANINLKSSLKSVSLCDMSELSRNNSDATSKRYSLQAVQKVTNSRRKQNYKSMRDKVQQDNSVTTMNTNLKH